MKAKYVKPTLCVEMFCLTQSIARDCGGSVPQSQLDHGDPNTCRWNMGGDNTVFIVNQHCTIDGTTMDYICYNNPSEGNFIFRS